MSPAGGNHAAQERYDAFERWVNPLMLVLSLAFFVIFLLELSPTPSPALRSLLGRLEVALWVTFALEFAVRFVLAPGKGVMLRRHLFDLVVIALPMLRPFRAVRAGRAVLRPLRAMVGLATMGKSLATARRIAQRRGAEWFILVVATATTSAGFLVRELESSVPGANIRNLGDALWWAVGTVSGTNNDVHYPVTGEGRFIGTMLMLLGLALFSVVTARVAAFFAGPRDDEVLARLKAIEARLERAEQAARPEGATPPREP